MEPDPFLALDAAAAPPLPAGEALSPFEGGSSADGAFAGAESASAPEDTSASEAAPPHPTTAPDAAASPPAPAAAPAPQSSGEASVKLSPKLPAKPPPPSGTKLTPTPAKAAPSPSAGGGAPDDLQEELATLLLKKQLPQTSVAALQNLLRENATLKEKNNKLKSLLGRSAKAQRDAKNELEQMKRLYEAARTENDRLEKRVEVLANRPTHMDLLADFETNFDRALLSIGGGETKSSQQSGGENAAESSSSSGMAADGGLSLYEDASRAAYGQGGKADSLLLTELNEAKARIAHLESLNNSFQGRYNNLEHTHKALLNDQQSSKNTLTNLQLELRMSKMETEHALRSLREKEAIVTEMQMEINLVTQSAVDANKRAAEGMEVAQGAKADKEYVDGLEAKVVALQEWALASTESKRLTTERCRGLEGRVKELEDVVRKVTSGGEDRLGSGLLDLSELSEHLNLTPRPLTSSSASSVVSGKDDHERKLWTQSSSVVVGAGTVGHAVLELGQVHIEPYETVVLRWKFDVTPGDLDIYFSVLKGIHEDKKKQRGADACFRNRHVMGGGAGDVSGAFAVQNACTLVWSNEMSWVRPRTVKWTVDAVAIEWSD
ncbi:hypothetical protein ACHAXT_011708 [Thalassiosira profunda]